MDITSGDDYPITNLLTGVSQISWSRDGSRLAFASFYDAGYDIYLINNPLDIDSGSVKLEKTAFILKSEQKKEPLLASVEDVPGSTGTDAPNYRNYVFGDAFRKRANVNKKLKKETFFDTTEYKNPEGDYKTKRYKIKFTPDLITGGAGYSQFFGLQGSTMIAFSDILGNHQINLYTDLFYSLKNSNFQLSYYYLPKRTDIGISVFHYSYLYYTYSVSLESGYPTLGYIRDRNYGFSLIFSRPFSKYRRVDFGVTALGIERDFGDIDPYGFSGQYMHEVGNLYKRRVLFLNLGYSTDTVIWGMTGPTNGGRSYLRATYSPSISKQYGLDFWTLRADWRRYLRVKKSYSFAMRVAGGISGGKNPQRFLLGGMLGWMNYQYNDIPYGSWGSDLFYFSSFETPLRGSLYYDQIGTRFLLTNLEFRFPLVQYLILGWPIPWGFQNIRGAVFMDIGSAWNDDKAWKPFGTNTAGDFQLHDLRMGYGVGARANLGFFLLKYDLAWGTNLNSTNKPIHYVTLGAEF